MRWLILQGGERRLALRSGALLVELRGEPVDTLQPDAIEAVHVYGAAEVTPAARALLVRRGIDLLFFSPKGRFLGQLLGPGGRAGHRRLAQLRAIADPDLRLAIAQSVVAGKLHNQYAHLARWSGEARSEAVAEALSSLRTGPARARAAPDLDCLRGVEGMAARRYFAAFPAGLRNPQFTFAGRNRRPPRDPINAVLSYLYTLLVAEMDGAVRAAGLDPFAGFLHEAGRSRPALTLDLIEEWRPLVDRLALGLFNRRELAPADFHTPHRIPLSAAPPGTEPDFDPPAEADEEPEPDIEDPEDPRPAVYLGEIGRAVVIRAWSRRLEEELRSPLADGRYPTRAIFRHQAALLARVVEGRADTYLPFAWR